MSGRVVRCEDRAALDAALATARRDAVPVAFVPTMGALHHAHRALVERAAALADVVVVSIFVNPTQFDAAADLASYPRTLDADLALLDEVAHATGVTLLAYTPDVDDVYPDGASRTLHVPEVTEHLCGASRPGHFDGVATVVDALLRAVRPTVLVLGRKDHQQLVVIRRLIAQQGHAVTVEAAPTVRDADAVAVSSRNALLDADARVRARRIPAALAEGVALVRAAAAAGAALDPDAVRTALRSALEGEGNEGEGIEVDYAEVVDPDRVRPLTGPQDATTPLLLAVAVHVRSGTGRVRLIDNVLAGDADDEQRLLGALAGAPQPRPADPQG